MTIDYKMSEKGYIHPAFQGLSDRDLVSIYKTTHIRNLKPGETLAREAESDETVYLILDGSAQLTVTGAGGEGETIDVLQRGDTVISSILSGGTKGLASVVAVSPLKAIVLTQTQFDTLSPHIRLVVYKNLSAWSQQRLRSVTAKQLLLSERYESLAGRMTHLLHTQSSKYEESELILGMLKGIPKLPMYANRLAVVILDENVSTRDVAELAKLDPSLVSIVLKTINSSYYGFQRKISDFQHAVLLLGFNQVYQLVMDVGLRNTMPNTPAFQELLFHSMMVSFVSFEIANLCQVKKAEAVSTAGLLHDVGKSVIMLLKAKHPKMEFLFDLMDHAKIGSLLLHEWNIPEVVCRSLAYQCHPHWLPPEKISKEHRTAVSVLYLAHLCYEYLAGSREDELPAAFLPDYLSELKRPERMLRDFLGKMVLPALKKKRKTYPENVREFITKGEARLAEFDGGPVSTPESALKERENLPPVGSVRTRSGAPAPNGLPSAR